MSDPMDLARDAKVDKMIANAEDAANVIVIEVQGDPKGQPRPRAFSRNGRARVYDPGTAEGWKGLIAFAAKKYLPSAPMECPIFVSLELRFRRPKSHYLKSGVRTNAPYYHTSKPDCDNAAKAVFDALTNLGMWKDDSQIVVANIAKVYHETPGATIVIDRLEKGQAA